MQDLKELLSKNQTVEVLRSTLHELLDRSPNDKIDIKTLKQALSGCGIESVAKAKPKRAKKQPKKTAKKP